MRKRNHVVPVRLNAKELRHLDGQVAKSGLSREEFLRSLILGAQLQTKPCEHHAELLRKGFATMPTSLPMLPMEQGWQGKPAYRRCSGFPKRPGVW
jgi:hypothetical protein